MRKINSFKLTQYMLLIIGIGFSAPATYKFIDSNNLVNNGLRAKGVVVRVVGGVRTHVGGILSESSGIVRFTTNKNEKVEITTYGATNKGNRVRVLYHSDSPEDGEVWSDRNLWSSAKLMGIIGSTTLAIYFSLIIYSIRKHKKKLQLLESGIKVNVTVTEILYRENIIIAGRHPYQIIAEWHDKNTGKTHSFRSDYVYEKPPHEPGKSKVIVYFDSRKQSRYFMDYGTL